MAIVLKKGSRVHLVGIKGVAMTALAQILQARGCRVTGSDGPEHFFTDRILKKLRIPYAQAFSPQNIPADVHAVISSAAYLHNGKALHNVEVAAALKRKLPTYTYPEVMAQLTSQYQTIGVAGSHGKSTTSAMLGWVLTACSVDPTVLVGSRVNTWDANARIGESETFVIEADEYREAFLKYKLRGAIVTSIDYDHPDYFKTPTAYNRAYRKLVDKLPKNGWLVICGDDHEARQLGIYAKAKGLRVLSYGFMPSNTIVLRDEGVSRKTNVFTAVFNGRSYHGRIPFVGKQYVLNSGAVLGVSAMLELDLKKAIAGLATFPGTARRLEIVKKTKNYVIIDDYAHHPTAIRITLEGVRASYPKHTLVAVFQPHMFSRTQALLEPFARAFESADEVGIMEIYPSARETTGPVTGRDLAARAKFFHRRVTYLPTMEAGKKYVAQHAKKGTVIVLMGAGNVNDLVKKTSRTA